MAGSTATRSRPKNLPKPGAAWELAILHGPDAGTAYLLDGTAPPCVHIGKSPTCEIRLSDPLVSRRHLALDLGGPLLHARDEGSTNGTFLHGAQIIEVRLRGGESLVLGDTTIRIRKVNAPSAPA